MSKPELDPGPILQVGLGFFASRAVLTAVKMELFTHLAKGALTALRRLGHNANIDHGG